MTDLPDAVVELTDEERAELATWAREGIYHCPCRMRCMCDDEDKVYLFDAVGSIIAARLAAASGPWAEQLDAARTNTDEALAEAAKAGCGELVERLQADLAAALARNAELQADIQNIAGGALVEEAETSVRRIHAEVERDVARQALTSADAMNRHWDEINAHRDLLVAERDALRAELDSLRASLTKRTHDWLAHCKRLDAEREAITDDLAKALKELGEIESGASEDE